jgi:hypothetical protein
MPPAPTTGTAWTTGTTGAPTTGSTATGTNNGGSNGTLGDDGGVDPDSGTDASGSTIDAGCLAGIEGYFDEGPFSFQMKESGKVKMWIPDVPDGCKVPMVHMANGTTANCACRTHLNTHIAST